MRIAHLVSGGDVAGGQLVALHVAMAARAAGHDVRFVAPAAGTFTRIAAEEGFPVDVVRLGGALDLASLVRLARVLRRHRVDLVHTHVHFSLNVLGRLAARLAGAVVVAHMHIENVFRAGRGRRAQIALDNATARLCASFLAVSRSTRDALVRQGYPADRIVVVHNGVDAVPAAAAAAVRPGGVAAEATEVLHVGRLAPVKGQRELIEGLALLDRADVVAVLVGEDLEQGGAYAAELERRAAALDVGGRVVLAGYRDDVPSLLAGCDLLALPSHVEGLPLVVLEAMAAGKPVVATRVGGTDELVVDGETGLLVEAGDVEGLARALAALADDPALRRRLGEAGRQRVVRQFATSTMVERVLAVYPSR